MSEIFKIGSVDEIGTIGGFRFGKTQRVEVGWDEINAALGQIVYLLCVLAHRLNYRFEKHFLHVNGRFSKISIRINQRQKGDLYYGNEEKFNMGLVLLLECVALFMEALKGEDTKLSGYKMKKCLIMGDKID